jgi:DNA-binding NarL/FixJ family response regulator
MIRVMLAEDQTLVRKGIRSLLGLLPDMEVAGEASDGEEALQLLPDIKPDVLLLDIRMPKLSGLEILEKLRGSKHLVPTIILTTFDDSEALFQGIKHGARGFLLKDVTLEQLAAAIREVAAGGTMIQPGVTEHLLRNLRCLSSSMATPETSEHLSARERQVIRLMVGGYRNREIADAFGVTEGTVKNHVSSILSKLGVRDRTRAVLKAIDGGLV